MNTLLMSPLLDSTGAVTHLLGVLTAKVADNDAVINRGREKSESEETVGRAALLKGGQHTPNLRVEMMKGRRVRVA